MVVSLQGGYSDATTAAAAAREYYLQAKLASEAAERWAQGGPQCLHVDAKAACLTGSKFGTGCQYH